MTSQITVNVAMWEGCRTPEELGEHAPDCLKVFVEVDGKGPKRSMHWYCLDTCPSRPISRRGYTAAELADSRARLRKGAA